MSKRAFIALLALALGVKRAGFGANLLAIDAAHVRRPGRIPVADLNVAVLRLPAARGVRTVNLAVLVTVPKGALTAVVTALTIAREALLLLLILVCSLRPG